MQAFREMPQSLPNVKISSYIDGIHPFVYCPNIFLHAFATSREPATERQKLFVHSITSPNRTHSFGRGDNGVVALILAGTWFRDGETPPLPLNREIE